MLADATATSATKSLSAERTHTNKYALAARTLLPRLTALRDAAAVLSRAMRTDDT
jgi:hypothetical protein